MKQDNFYVSIAGPHVLRKELLTGAKGVIGVLRGHQDFRSVREEKHQEILKLKKILADLAGLTRKVRTMMPKLPGKEGVQKQGFLHRNSRTPAKPRTHVDALETELAKIEERLNAID